MSMRQNVGKGFITSVWKMGAKVEIQNLGFIFRKTKLSFSKKF